MNQGQRMSSMKTPKSWTSKWSSKKCKKTWPREFRSRRGRSSRKRLRNSSNYNKSRKWMSMTKRRRNAKDRSNNSSSRSSRTCTKEGPPPEKSSRRSLCQLKDLQGLGRPMKKLLKPNHQSSRFWNLMLSKLPSQKLKKLSQSSQIISNHSISSSLIFRGSLSSRTRCTRCKKVLKRSRSS